MKVKTNLLLLLGLSWLSLARLDAANRIPAHIPDFTLKDLGQKEFTQKDLLAQGAVVILTIPNIKHAKFQDQWGRWLTKKGWSEKYPRIFFIQDMPQAQSLRAEALVELKKRYRVGEQPFLLLDESSVVRKNFGVQNDETILLVVNDQGRIVKMVDDDPSLGAVKEVLEVVQSLERIKKVAPSKVETAQKDKKAETVDLESKKVVAPAVATDTSKRPDSP